MSSFTRKGDFWAGLVMAALGMFVVTQAYAWDYMTEDGPGAGFFPLWYGIAMLGARPIRKMQDASRACVSKTRRAA